MSQGLNKEELIKLVEKICNVEGTEEEIDEWLEILKTNVPHPSVTDLIYWTDEDLTPEQIVDKALSYKPIILP